MDSLPEVSLLRFQPDTLESVRKEYGLDKPGAMSEAIDILDTWVKQQTHFVKKDYPKDYLERTIISAKGSVERAKERLEKICTFRTLTPRFFGDFDINKDFKDLSTNVVRLTILPDMTKEFYRVIFVKICDGDLLDSKFIINCFQMIFMTAELIRKCDYINGITFIGDFRDVHLSKLISIMNPMDIHQGFSILMQGYGLRINGIHFLSESKLIEGVVAILKQVLSAKVGDRIKVHKTLESLYTVVPKEILPNEYGGKEKSLTDIQKEWMETLSSTEFREHQRDMAAACTDESLRQTKLSPDQYMGIPGTFRSLNVD